MAELKLPKDQRLALKAQAHSLDPVVLLGAAGLSDAALAEIDRALKAHALIKVRVPLDDRAEREGVFAQIATRLGAARVQAIGKLIVLYRPPEDEPAPPPPQTRRATRTEARSGSSDKRRPRGRQT